MKNKILYEVKKTITDSFKNESPIENVYHNYEHTIDVVEKVLEIGEAHNLNKTDLEILQIAAYFHDIGHFNEWENHEDNSALTAQKFLEEHNYVKDNIGKVYNCIIATKLLHHPKNLLEKIIKDADLSYLGAEDFFERSALLKKEIEKREKRTIPDKDWLKINVEFLSVHKFFTEYAEEKFAGIKNNNLTKLKQLYLKVTNNNQT